MKMSPFTLTFSLALICQINSVFPETINSELVIRNVDRSIDLASQLVKNNVKMSVENTGSSPIKSILYVIDPAIKDHLAYISASLIGSNSENARRLLQILPTTVDNHRDKSFWRIELRNPLAAGKTLQVEVESIFSHHLVPYPSHITQAEKQYVLYHGNVYFYSPYTVAKQTTVVTLTSSTIESYTKLKPVSQSENVITYGPYERVQPLTLVELIVHYENNSPFLTVSDHDRTVEVSHWGNIAVEESIDLRHTGAILKGPFSRYEYQRDQNGISSVKSFKTVLPAAATDVYYRDEIGNISTSNLRILDDAVEADLRPRFPLFGGWKTHYVIGYNLPSYEYLYNTGDDFVLKMRFIDHIYDDMIVEESVVKIILPEGAINIELKTPFEVLRERDGLHFTYLDTTGRPVVIARKRNLVESHIQEFELHYTYQKLYMLQEPLLVVLAFYLLFILVIIYVRLDFSITKDEASESKLKIASMCEQVQIHHERRTNIYQHYENAINQFKSSKDNGAFQATQKKLTSEHKNEGQQIVEIINKLKLEASDLAEKVGELQKLDRLFKEQIGVQITYAERLVAGKMKKEQYLDMEQGINKKKDEISEKMENIINSF
uniref:Dolichyl-diphosphooligosaccharide--protein glycosyltransferase subunit 1 n=1 Tax=Hemiscolopendra marginata TaxID=943146 RepID=A0A646QCR6_9MYRI